MSCARPRNDGGTTDFRSFTRDGEARRRQATVRNSLTRHRRWLLAAKTRGMARQVLLARGRWIS